MICKTLRSCWLKLETISLKYQVNLICFDLTSIVGDC